MEASRFLCREQKPNRTTCHTEPSQATIPAQDSPGTGPPPRLWAPRQQADMGTDAQDAGQVNKGPVPHKGRVCPHSLWEGRHTRKDMLGPALGQSSDREDIGLPIRLSGAG